MLSSLATLPGGANSSTASRIMAAQRAHLQPERDTGLG